MGEPEILPFDWADPFDLDASADRRGADGPRHRRSLCAGEAPAARHRGLSRRAFRPRDHARDGRARPARRDHPARIWRRRPRLCQLRPDRARGRAGRQRLPLGDVGAVEPRHAPDPRLRQRGAAQEISARAGQRRVGRLLRPDRARRRLRPRRDADPGAEDRTAAIASPAPRCGSPIRRSPTCSSSGRSRTRMAARSAASCSKRA